MNKTAAEAFVLATEVAQLVKSEVPADVQVIMATPALYLTGVSQVVEGIENGDTIYGDRHSALHQMCTCA